MKIEINTETGLCHAQVEGEMTIYTTEKYREMLLEQCHSRQGMDLDLANVTEMDTSGLQLLVALNKDLSKTARGLRLVNPGDAVRDVLDLTQLAETFLIHAEEVL
ncbi:MAG: STAS domain-containing protein [Pontibacterium sp.]